MLSSTTRAAARALSARGTSTFAQALPAESSRQGLQRAIAQQQRQQLADQKRALHHRRRHGSTYSTAVAFAEDERSDRPEDAGFRHWNIGASEPEVAEYQRQNRTSDSRLYTPRDEADALARQLPEDGPSPADDECVEADVPALDSWASLIDSDPLEALLLLPRYPSDQLKEMSARNLNDLLKNIYKTYGAPSADRPALLSSALAKRPLFVLRTLLHSLPSSARSNDNGLGKRFRRDLLSRFLRACAIFDCDDLLEDTLRERLAEQNKTGEVIVQPDMLATVLSARRRWDLLVKLLSPSNFPVSSYTPYTIQRLIQANLGLGQANRVPGLFRLHADLNLSPTPRSYSLLIEANLVLGDIQAVRQVMRDAVNYGNEDEVAQRLSILRGHRALGKDEDLERKMLESLDDFQPAQQAAIVHALIRLRLDADDRSGARQLLARFRLDRPWSPTGIVDRKNVAADPWLEPNEQTYDLAFRAEAPTMSMSRLAVAWRHLATVSASTMGTLAVVLLDALGRHGHLDLMRSLLRHGSASFESLETEPVFETPIDFRPETKHLNILLRHSCRMEGLPGLERTLRLFRTCDIMPDERTLQTVVESVRDTTTSDPTQLATLLNSLLRHSPHLQPTVDHVDVLMSQAIRAQSRNKSLAARSRTSSDGLYLDSPAEATSDNAQAGLRPSDPFKQAMKGIIQSLRARGGRSVSRSLATRLRFDAQSRTDGSVPSAQTVWDDMISRGYKPDKRHLLALMKGYAESGNMRECEDIILLAKDTEIPITRGMWMVIMTAYGKRDNLDVERAERAFEAIKRSEQGLDPAAVCAMIGIYLRAKRRHMASHLALQLVGNLTPAETTSTPTNLEASIPPFPRDMLDERVIAIAADALRLDHPRCALEAINAAFPSHLPTRVRQVVKSIRSRSRARIQWNVANPLDADLLARAEEMLSSDASSSNLASPASSSQRPAGPAGVRKRLLRLFSRKRHTTKRGSGGRKVITAKAERKARHEAQRIS